MINMYAIYLSGIVYVTLSLFRLLKYRRNMVQQFSNTERINFNWLLYLIIWMVIIWTVVLFVQEDKLIFGAASLFVVWIGYFGIKQVQVFTQRPSTIEPQKEIKSEFDKIETNIISEDETANTSKYQKSTLSEEEVTEIHERLKDPDGMKKNHLKILT